MSLSFRVIPKKNKLGDLTNQETRIVAHTWTKVLGGSRKFLSKSTDILVKPDDWNHEKQEIRKTDSDCFDKNKKLTRIKSRFADLLCETTFLGKLDLSKVIYADSQQILEEEQTSLIDYCDYFIEQMPTLINKNGGQGYSPDTIKQYRSFRKLLDEWICFRNNVKIVTLQNIEMADLNNFVTWMNEKGFSQTTMNKRVSYLKRIASFALENGIKNVSGYFAAMKKPRADKKEADQIIFLDYKQMQSVINLQGLSDGLENARKIAAVQYATAARVMDVLGLVKGGKQVWPAFSTSNFITNKDGEIDCHYTAHKTKKKLIIPIVDGTVLRIIEFDMFRPTTHQVYNRHLKDLCKLAGVTEIIEGTIRTSKNTVKKIHGEKWKFISSHDLRRTKISEMWNSGVDVRLILSVSGHRDENVLKSYLGITGKQDIANELRSKLICN